jgi:hypothetical protein
MKQRTSISFYHFYNKVTNRNNDLLIGNTLISLGYAAEKSSDGIIETSHFTEFSNAIVLTYTFTRALGQCANPVTINITVEPLPIISPLYHD